jgi:hypothetical protein
LAISIDLPKNDRDETATVIELTMSGNAFNIEPLQVPCRSGSLARGKPTTASNVYLNQAQYSAQCATDDDEPSRWATDFGQKAAWREVDLGEPTKIGRVYIDEPAEYQRIQSFELQYFDGEDWRAFYRGTTIGPELSIDIAPIAARRVRLNILKATDGPTIREFQLYAPSP